MIIMASRFKQMRVQILMCLVVAVLVDTSTSDQPPHIRRSIASAPVDSEWRTVQRNRTVQRLVGGHLNLNVPTADPTQSTQPLEDGDRDSMMLASAGRGKEKSKTKKDDEDDEKKTLADQVAEGKYGLIQKELFTAPITRPGIVSYAVNSEVPADSERNLGGLEPEEIWLAEDHLLVLRGGRFQEHNAKTQNEKPWPPIDDYQAPPRQVKIPHNPKIPPPFPVQLQDGGPLEFLGPNGSRVVPFIPPPPANGSYPLPQFPFPFPPDNYPPGQGPVYPPGYPGNFTPGDSPFPIPPYPFGPPPNNYSGPPYPFPGAPPVNGSYPSNGGPGPFPPFPLGGPYPPGFPYPLDPAAYPDNGNFTDMYDEDDPSIYYPPPYSFYYPKDNVSLVPAGPLVPGIILPPPPNFFAPLKESTTISPFHTTATPPTTTSPAPSTTIRNKYLLPKRPTPRPTTKLTTAKPTRIYTTTHSPEDNFVEHLITPLPPQYTPAIGRRPNVPIKNVQILGPQKNPDLYYFKRPSAPVTTSKPLPITKIHTTLKSVPQYPAQSPVYDDYYDYNAVTPTPRPYSGYTSPVRQTPPNQGGSRTYVSSTAVPLRAYYSVTRNENTNSVTPLPINFKPNSGQQAYYRNQQSTPPSASYYFYEENPTTTQAPNDYYDKPYYNNDAGPQQQYIYNSYGLNS